MIWELFMSIFRIRRCAVRFVATQKSIPSLPTARIKPIAPNGCLHESYYICVDDMGGLNCYLGQKCILRYLYHSRTLSLSLSLSHSVWRVPHIICMVHTLKHNLKWQKEPKVKISSVLWRANTQTLTPIYNLYTHVVCWILENRSVVRTKHDMPKWT